MSSMKRNLGLFLQALYILDLFFGLGCGVFITGMKPFIRPAEYECQDRNLESAELCIITGQDKTKNVKELLLQITKLSCLSRNLSFQSISAPGNVKYWTRKLFHCLKRDLRSQRPVWLTSLPTKPVKATSRRELTKFLKDKERKKKRGKKKKDGVLHQF